jgi:hypothetical protein
VVIVTRLFHTRVPRLISAGLPTDAALALVCGSAVDVVFARERKRDRYESVAYMVTMAPPAVGT